MTRPLYPRDTSRHKPAYQRVIVGSNKRGQALYGHTLRCRCGFAISSPAAKHSLRRQYLAHILTFARETRSLITDALIVALFAVCVALHSTGAQLISWSHAVGAATTLTIGVRVDPRASRQLDATLRRVSPYGVNRLADGSPLLPDRRLWARTCDRQHLERFGIGDWCGSRIYTMAVWCPAAAVGSAGSHALGVSRSAATAIGLVGPTAFNLIRARSIPDYHLDALGYAAGIGSWGVACSYLAARNWTSWGWKLPLVALDIWLIAYPWSTPVSQ